MENLTEAEELRRYLAEAVEMLDDVKPKLALFEKQRYFKFKAALKHYCRHNASLQNQMLQAGAADACSSTLKLVK